MEKNKAEIKIDVDEVQMIINNIKSHKDSLRTLEDTPFEKDDVMEISILKKRVILHAFHGRDSQTNLVENIIRIIRMYHEDEIYRLSKELVELVFKDNNIH